MQISEKFKIKSVNYDSEVSFACAWVKNSVGVLENTKLARFEGNATIGFCFDNDFIVEVKREVVKNSYNKNINSKDVVLQISNDIEKAWLDKIKNN